MRKARFAAAALAVVSVMSFAPAANAATCQPIVDSTLGVHLSLCGEVDTDPSSLPSLRYESLGDPTSFAIYLDVPEEFGGQGDVWLRYQLGGPTQEYYLPPNGEWDSSICVFYTAPAAAAPGTCIFGISR
ncbi:MAG TPA: hypothetical protein VEV43_00330 [Actinomycetota bacterium]|nr:hypothetical protein [Actinomycetota bacterium]